MWGVWRVAWGATSDALGTPRLSRCRRAAHPPPSINHHTRAHTHAPPTAGATGGFAGGEAGLDQYVSTGQVRLRDPNQPGGATQSSPVAVAGLLVLAGGGGTLLLNELTDLGTNAVKSEILDVSFVHALRACACVVGAPHRRRSSCAAAAHRRPRCRTCLS
jgi:hypothetical protein